MNKKLLIVYGKGTAEIQNRGSALGSYIFCLAGLLAKSGCEVWVNNEPYHQLSQKNTSTVFPRNAGGIKKILKSTVPTAIKHVRNQRNRNAKNRNILSALPNENFDVILEFYVLGSNLGLMAQKKYDCKRVVVFDAPVVDEYEFFNGKDRLYRNHNLKKQEQTLHNAHAVVVYNEPMRQYVLRHKAPAGKIFIHQNIDFSRFDFIEPRVADEQMIIGFIGSFLKWHRVDLLIHVFNRLRNSGVNARLLLLGSGQELESIKMLAAASPFSSDIEIPGYCDGEKLLAYKKQMHIGVMPGSNWYGAPNKIFEYGAAGLAVLAPDTPAIADLFFKHQSVVLFKHDNEDDAFAKLQELCVNKNLLNTMQQKLHKHIVSGYGDAKTLTFYQQLLF